VLIKASAHHKNESNKSNREIVMNFAIELAPDAGVLPKFVDRTAYTYRIVPPKGAFEQQAHARSAARLTTVREIAFIDCEVSDFNTLLAGLRPGVEAVVLTAARSATAQMATVLRERSGLKAIHVIAHGRPGEVSFGAGPLSLETIDAQATDLMSIGEALAHDGRLLLWSCEAGKGRRGDYFIDALSARAA
jgi:hypothetical protein